MDRLKTVETARLEFRATAAKDRYCTEAQYVVQALVKGGMSHGDALRFEAASVSAPTYRGVQTSDGRHVATRKDDDGRRLDRASFIRQCINQWVQDVHDHHHPDSTNAGKAQSLVQFVKDRLKAENLVPLNDAETEHLKQQAETTTVPTEPHRVATSPTPTAGKRYVGKPRAFDR